MYGKLFPDQKVRMWYHQNGSSKHAADGSIEKYKAKFVTRGFSQKEGIEYEETFAPVARYISIRTMKWKLH